MVHTVLQALLLTALPTPSNVLQRAGVTQEATRLESRFHPAASRTRGGRLEVVGEVDGVPLTQPLAKVWIADDGSPVLTTATRSMGPVRGGTTPTIPRREALASLAGSGQKGSRGATTATLMVDPGPVESQLVWRIDPPVDPATFSNPLFFVDAHTGTITRVFDRTRDAQVEAFEVNPVQTPEAQVFELADVDEGAEFLQGQYFQIRNCTLSAPDAQCIYAPTLIPDENGDFFYPIPDISVQAEHTRRDDAYAEISAYYNADRFHAYLAAFGDPGLDCSQGETSVSIRVNQHDFSDGEMVGFDNAFYTGDCNQTVVMGQGTEVDFAWDGEVILHELAHGITDRQTGPNGSLGGARRDEHSAGNDAGAINEGTSDFFGTVLSGERIYGNYTGPEFERDLGTEMTCPAGLAGEIHDDGILWASTLLDVTDELGPDFPPVVIDTLGMLPLDVSFGEAASTLETLTLDALGPDAADVVHEVFSARGLIDCERVAAIEDAQYGMWLLPANWDVDYNPVRPPPFQLRFDVPDDAVNLTVSFVPRDFLPEGTAPNWAVDIVLKPDEPIIFSYEDATGLTYVEADSSEQHSFEDNTWTRDVAGGEVLYAAVFNRGNGMVQLRDIQVEYELAPAEGSSSSSGGLSGGTAADETGEPPTESGSSTSGESTADSGESGGETMASDDDTGCGCRSDGRNEAGWLLLLGLGVAVRRRRSSRPGKRP